MGVHCMFQQDIPFPPEIHPYHVSFEMCLRISTIFFAIVASNTY